MVNGFRWKPFFRANQRGSAKEVLFIVPSIITVISNVTSLHVGFERIITPLCTICFTIILIFAFDSSFSFHPLFIPYNDLFRICRSSWSCMLISTYEIHAEMMTYLLSYHDPLVEPLEPSNQTRIFRVLISIDWHEHPQLRDARWADDLTSFCLDPPVEPFLSHSVRPIFSDVVMILGCRYLRCIDSHIIISVEYRSDLLYVPIESFSSYQDRPNALVAILGHILPLF
ncbi:hypothetical protein AAG906_013046 [Vitis piasezkii]